MPHVEMKYLLLQQLKAKAEESRLNSYRSQPFFLLDVTLKEGRDLVIRDSCG